jgi:glutathione S-transferase
VSHGSALREYVENGERRLQMELNRLNTVFLEQAPFLTGETPTMADISCACAVSLLDWVSRCARRRCCRRHAMLRAVLAPRRAARSLRGQRSLRAQRAHVTTPHRARVPVLARPS